MRYIFKYIQISIATISLVAMFFSCTNNPNEVRDFLADTNRPIGVATDIIHVYKDSGFVTNRLQTKLMLDFSNRKQHPYNEFPKGIKIVAIDKRSKDSTTITGQYAISYKKTSVSEIKGNVIILNHTENMKLETNQLFWDQKESYFFTENAFRLSTPNDTITGYGFESKQDLSEWVAKDIQGQILINQKGL